MKEKMKYMLDSCVCVEMLRNRAPGILKRVMNEIPGTIGISSITVAELYYGAEKSQYSKKNRQVISQFMLPLEVKDFDTLAGITYGKVRIRLEKLGTPIGALDMQIAAHALSIGAAVVTDNLKHFERVAGLTVKKW